MSKNEIDIPRQEEELKIRPYEHHAKYYETDQIGLNYKQMEEMEIISPVLSISVEYHSMVHFDDTVVIQTKLVKYTGVKMEVEYIMTDKETGELRTTAYSSHCFLNRSGKPISLKRSYPELDTKFFEMKDEI